MAEYKLPSATSVVDYLDTAKRDSSYTARSKLYTDSGLSKRLGDFRGTPTQNMALLDTLRGQDAAPKAPTIGNVQTSTPATTALATATAAPTATNPFSFKTPVQPPSTIGQFSLPPVPKATDVLQSAGAPVAQGPQSIPGAPRPSFGVAPTAPSATQTVATAPPAGGGAPTGQISTPEISTTTQGGTTEVNVSTVIPTSSSGAEQDLVQEFLTSQEGLSLLDKNERGGLDAVSANTEAKRLLEAKYATDKASLEQRLAENGLAFSGIRASQVKALADELAASELDVDRKLASKLLDADASLRDGIIKGVADLVKAAADKDAKAIQQLNAVGLAVINGKLVPTLAARSAQRADEQLEISQRRLELAEQSANLAERRFMELYGAEKGKDGFDFVRQLMELNPNATKAELKVAALENTKLSATEIDSALNLIGVPANLQPTIAASYVNNYFSDAGLLANLVPGGKSSETELQKAKEDAKKAILSTGGVISIKGGETYNISGAQLESLANMVDTVSLDDVRTISSQLAKDKAK